jgi:hypothetical protein
MWDCNGMEQIHDISAFEEESEARMFAILAGTEPEPDSFPNIEIMRLRARYNTPRDYHIAGIKLPAEITDDMIRETFKSKDNRKWPLARYIVTRSFYIPI